MQRPKKAMIMGAGLGKRMMPLTADQPKPMVALQGRPLIDHVLDRLVEAGIEQAVVNVHYKADVLEEHLKKRHKPDIIISDERDQLLDTGGGIKKALPLLGTEPFIVHNSDSVWIEGDGPSNLDRLICAWDEQKMDCLLLMALGSTSLGYDGKGDFAMNADGRLKRRGEGETVPFVFTGVSITHPRVFDHEPHGVYSLNKIWNRAIEQRRLFGIRHEGVWMHIGTPEALKEAEKFLSKR